ncbi:MAG: IS1-like element transposase [Cyanobacteria bacterium P01_H01_bin.152]
MVLGPVCCPHGPKTNVVKNGKSGTGKQRDRCRSAHCARAAFILDDIDRRDIPEVKAPVSELAINGSGIRNTARVLRISPTTVMAELQNTSSPGIDAWERFRSVSKFTVNCSNHTG